ncbi:hypothetical protein [Demequina globuliformis]|uniref:hypothetical protein n=1 Tax=Demequina globuliformis TaxID=676202 RepID=UPI00078344F3|nr:hypothetical protein [Demequina globuliformis]
MTDEYSRSAEQSTTPAERWAYLAKGLTIGAGIAVLIAVVYFGGGLTVPDASAQVTVDRDVLNPASLPDGNLKGVTASATFEYSQVSAMADRAGTRLTAVALWLTLALTFYVLSRFARRMAAKEPLMGPMRRRDWRLAAAAAACAGLLVPLGVWAQGVAVLAAAGNPKGIDPVVAVGWAWLALAAVCLLVAGPKPPRLPRRDHDDSVDADR